MADFEVLGALQDIDNSTDQIGHRRTRLPERAALTEAAAQRKAALAAGADAARRNTEATAEVEVLERDGHALDAKRARFEQQLKTVIAPREAEALMHEIELLNTNRAAADDRELELLDVIETAEADAALHASDAAAALSRQDEARAAVMAAEAALDAELAELERARTSLIGRLDPGVLQSYERRRSAHKGVALSRLVHGRCSGCHLDLSHSFLDHLRNHAGDEPMECEQCGRWLIP